MRLFIFTAQKKNGNEWVTGDYLYNDYTKNHIIATEKKERQSPKHIDYGSSYDFWLVKPETLRAVEKHD